MRILTGELLRRGRHFRISELKQLFVLKPRSVLLCVFAPLRETISTQALDSASTNASRKGAKTQRSSLIDLRWKPRLVSKFNR